MVAVIESFLNFSFYFPDGRECDEEPQPNKVHGLSPEQRKSARSPSISAHSRRKKSRLDSTKTSGTNFNKLFFVVFDAGTK